MSKCGIACGWLAPAESADRFNAPARINSLFDSEPTRYPHRHPVHALLGQEGGDVGEVQGEKPWPPANLPKCGRPIELIESTDENPYLQTGATGSPFNRERLAPSIG